MHGCNTTSNLKYKRRRIRRQRIAPTGRIRRDKKKKILPEGSAKLRSGQGGRGPHISQPLWSNGKKKALDVGGPSSIDFIYFWGFE
jgi:hypothetical protein